MRYRAIPQVRDLRAVAPAPEPAPEPEPEPAEEVSYRDLQAQAKALDIPANQSRDELEAAIAEASDE